MDSLIGKLAPRFNAAAVVDGCSIVGNFSLEQYVGKKYVLFFFYPKDFTFVCPTELHAFQEKIHEFEKRGVQLVACSTDSEFAHLAWLGIPRGMGGIKGITFPIVADINKTISADYGVLAGHYEEDENGELSVVGELVAYRGLFLIDKSGTVQHCVINNMPLGRSVDEALRMVDALQHFEQFGEVCPANWGAGKKAMAATQTGLVEYFK
jgi:peroxiredoxin (alkyl hydroperoxide reductase subunit C)